MLKTAVAQFEKLPDDIQKELLALFEEIDGNTKR